jgi:hypothetical protein
MDSEVVIFDVEGMLVTRDIARLARQPSHSAWGTPFLQRS